MSSLTQDRMQQDTSSVAATLSPTFNTLDRDYDVELSTFESIASNNAYIVRNKDMAIDNESGLQILYAMLKQKPIVLTNTPTIDPSMSTMIKRALKLHLPQVEVLSMQNDHKTLTSILSTLPSRVDYRLSPREEVLIKLYTKAYFRALLPSNTSAEYTVA